MVEHSEAPKNPQNPTEKSGSEYQPLWDMEQPAPDYSALLLHGTPVPAPTGEIPEPVREVLEIPEGSVLHPPLLTPRFLQHLILRCQLWRFLLLRRLCRRRIFSLRRRGTRC